MGMQRAEVGSRLETLNEWRDNWSTLARSCDAATCDSLGPCSFLLLSLFTDLRGNLHRSNEMRHKMLFWHSHDRPYHIPCLRCKFRDFYLLP